ncbi:hypothetical protein N7468_009282 [Penicillium chermesinum]|uniref:Uncharacterized protein n=1 Tax=Penicillium chermesinum TaxID=63820 RepID=A0A9W9NHU4_9EURO|nr:uncharacterized protein N7468_009282 [Penicillium chermesinum]KAJ5220078.1 hypothetical protein N7468_009282 [Penicillium chermesinum]
MAHFRSCYYDIVTLIKEHGSFTQWGPRSSPFRVVEKNSLNTPASTNTTSSSEASFHTTTILSLWQRFLERVDPVLKMIHVPTTQQKIVDVATARVTGGIEMQALIGSICYSAVVTTSVDECWHEFGRGREEILGE